MIELEENINDDTLVGMLKRAAINAVDNHARLISGINNLVIKRDDQQDDLCKLVKFSRKLFFCRILFVIAVNETLTLIRRQYEEFEREKQNLLLEHSSRDQTFRSELEKITGEKEYEQIFN